MTDDDIRKMVILEASLHSATDRDGTGVAKWCAVHDLHKSAVSNFMNRKRPPPGDMLKALGLEWRIVRSDDEDHSLLRLHVEQLSRTLQTIRAALSKVQ